jgi:hypothetical protein
MGLREVMEEATCLSFRGGFHVTGENACRDGAVTDEAGRNQPARKTGVCCSMALMIDFLMSLHNVTGSCDAENAN